MAIIKIGITGQAGFVGTHLYNTLGIYPEQFERIPFEDSYFSNEDKLKDFIQRCDSIVHLAAINRHNNAEVIYKTNVELVKKLVLACEATQSKPSIIFSSSIQEDLDNLYGRSKKDGRKLLEQWAERNQAQFMGLVIPNVFGPFGNPYYNSVVATFCHQLTHNELPKIDIDSEIELIYVGELVQKIIDHIQIMKQVKMKTRLIERVSIPFTKKIRVSQLLEKLKIYKEEYFDKGKIPCLDDLFDKNLFNTFLCYIDHDIFFPFELKQNTDPRGRFVETMKLQSGGQVSFSSTFPGISRGNHYHTRKTERFAVIEGHARIEIRRIGTDQIISFELNGINPSFVDIPIWYTHKITNIGNGELYTLFWINEHFDSNDPDTFFEIV